MGFSENVSSVEAVLFAYGEPVSCAVISEATGIGRTSVPSVVRLLNERYDECHSALQVLKLKDSFQLTTRKEYAGCVRKALETGHNSSLSSASMETLAIIAYNQPVTRTFVDNIRGVDSSSVISKLVEKELIEEAERLDVPGRPVAYRTTANFLRCFGLSSEEDLPDVFGNKTEPDLFNQEAQEKGAEKNADTDSRDTVSDSTS